MRSLMPTALAVGLALTAAPATAQPSEHASCVATVTAFETTLAPGFVGAEVSYLAMSGGSAFAGHVTSLAHSHKGSVQDCFAS